MPSIDPELSLRLASETAAIYGNAQATMLEKVSRRLARGIDEEGWAEQKRSQIKQLRREALTEVQRLDRQGPASVRRALNEGHKAGRAAAAAENVVEIPGRFIGIQRPALESLVKETVDRVLSTHTMILRSTLDAYRAVIAESSIPGVITGTETRREAAQRALDRFARQGITGFTDKAGRNWQLESYVEMATRTGSGHAMIEGRLQQYQADGHDLVIVSDAPEECPVCRPWEGKVLSISGRTSGKLHRGFSVAGTVSEATAAGLLHANCRHDLRRYVPGLTNRHKHTKDPEGSEERVRQRTLERRVRERKRQDITARSFADVDRSAAARQRAQQSRQQLQKARADLTGFIEKHDRKRLRYREGITSAI